MTSIEKKIKYNIKLAGPNHKVIETGLRRNKKLGLVCTYCAALGHETRNCHVFLEDSTLNEIKEDSIGEWVKADKLEDEFFERKLHVQVLRRIHLNLLLNLEKKPPPSWLLEGFSSLSMEERQLMNLKEKDKDAKVSTNDKLEAVTLGSKQHMINDIALVVLQDLQMDLRLLNTLQHQQPRDNLVKNQQQLCA
ncbi:hypothetical protein PIB30_006600 [Stylosanthes scabra]|uniref:Uncharacterized protein n=1 Tax=Stylosanthes scabra TaxID=79078 RepID=A0ABU6Z268_9FABA|nr:hypothetical protein [Stylosanthes scabra]